MQYTNTNPFEAIFSQLLSIKGELADIRSSLTSSSASAIRWYTIKKAAENLNVAEITLYRGCLDGSIPSKKIGTRRMIPSSYVEGCLSANPAII